ncbi:MAG: hypothetical protein EBS39_10925 [Gammaproteobacteria bacterium]|nr:hypothetical protein [Gammaproteobacteria bacterium]
MTANAAVAGRVDAILGPVIVTTELARQLQLFGQVVGMRVEGDSTLDEAATGALFGTTGRKARVVRMTTPGTPIGVWLVEFTPGVDTVIRVGGRGVACNALKMIDFFTADRPAAIARLRAHGFEIVDEGASVDLPDGSRFREAHAKGPDGVMVAAIEPLNVDAATFVSVTDQPFSEVQSSSGPVADFEPVRAFYQDVLGVMRGFHYEFESESFSRMVGVDRLLRIRADNYGRVLEDVMLGIIHYGLPLGSYDDLRERAQPPNRGLVGVRLSVEGLDDLLARCRAAGLEVPCDAHRLDLPGSAPQRVAAVRAPHGVWHWFFEPQRGGTPS